MQYVKDAGVWKPVKAGYAKDAGVWKPVKAAHVRDAGVWKLFGYKQPLNNLVYAGSNNSAGTHPITAPATDNRWAIAIYSTQHGGNAAMAAPTGITINGSSGYFHRITPSSHPYHMCIAYVKIPTGSTVTPVVAGNVGISRISWYTADDLDEVVALTSVHNATAAAVSITPTAPAAIFGAVHGSWTTVGSRSATWTGLTEVWDMTLSNGRHGTAAWSEAVLEPATLSVNATLSPATDQQYSKMVVALGVPV